jgi:hypothetical protein
MYEPAEGKTNAVQVKAMARWCKERGIRTKGHPLVWTLEPAWVGEKPVGEAQALLWGRVTRDVTDFAGLTDIWDVVNEAVVGPDQARARNARTLLGLYERQGRLAVVSQAFAVAREANPKATLVLNDFRTDESYEKILEEALAKGVSIDVIGIQSHMHGGYWGAAKAWEVCERFARFGGINVVRIIVLCQLILGLLAGLGGMTEVMGIHRRFNWQSFPGYGWDGVVVAIIGRNHPLLIIAASFFLSYLRVGGQVLNLMSDVPSEMVTVIQWIIILLITAEAFLSQWRFRIMVRQAERFEEAR